MPLQERGLITNWLRRTDAASTPTWPSPTSPASSSAPPGANGLEWLGRLLIAPRRFVLSAVEGNHLPKELGLLCFDEA